MQATIETTVADTSADIGADIGAELAEQAVLYAYPLYEMARMRAATSPKRIVGGADARATADNTAGEAPSPLRWCNVFTHARQLLGAGKSRVVTPNNDTLYTNAWLDLGDGPLVIDVPDTAGRYYVLGLLDFYTNPFAHIGQRLTGTAARSFVVTPPGWRGTLPAAFDEAGAHIAAPTRWLWVIGRILVDGPQDVPAVNALQEGFRVRTLGDWHDSQDWQAGRPSAPKQFDPGFDPGFAPASDAKAPMTADHFAAQVNHALRENPPPARDAGLLARFTALGLGSNADALDDTQRGLLQHALDAVLPRLRNAQSGATTASGWVQMPLVEGSFGDDHLARALVALKYTGMLESREATYPLAWRDAAGRALHGSHRYTLRFAPGALPPVDAFWSLTMYDSRDYMLVGNPIDRYAIGDRTTGLRHDADGGLTLHIQHARPENESEAAQANWLPAPEGDFYLCLRAYMPRAEMLDGRYTLPALVRAGEAA